MSSLELKENEPPEQLSPKAKELLEKQGYVVVGSHSVVKPCGWTKKMMKGEGGCYKFKFYGIRSHQCLQMSSSVSCANRCSFCWRDYKSPVGKEWKWKVDNPGMIIDESIKGQLQKLIGFKGNDQVHPKIFEQAQNIRHVALSLTGEPITYPRMNEMIKEFHKRKISTFIVTNGQYPEAIKNLDPITQLYISVDAPDKPLLKKIDVPLFDDYWQRMIDSLDAMAKREDRTCVRLTCIKEENMCDEDKYAELIKRGDPDFIEIKGYMFVGASRQRLSLKNMPFHEEVMEFALKILEHLPEYEYVSEHKASRVILLAKKSFNKKTWIDFEGFFEKYAL